LRDFYKEVLQVEADGENVFVFILTEGAALSIYSAEGMEERAPGSLKGAGRGYCTIEFEVENVDAEYKRIEALNVPIVKPPTTQPWGRRSFWFRDPDGNIVNFYMDVKVD
jgi:catechol 2,3-dioxygenase-like lactoylglutathione lyase family enzyme